MRIKPLEISEISDAMLLCRKFWEETPIFSRYRWDNEKTFDIIADSITEDDSCIYIAFEDSTPVGIIRGSVEAGTFTRDKWLYADLVYVVADKRGSSIGKKLVNKWIEFGESKDIVDMWFSVNSGIDMNKSVEFFKSMDFKVAGMQMRKEMECVD